MQRLDSPDAAVMTPPFAAAKEFSAIMADDPIRDLFPGLSTSPTQPAILLIADGGVYLVFRLLRILHAAGVAVDLLCLARHPLQKSRYVRHVCEASTWRDLESKATRIMRSSHRPWRRVLVAHEPTVRHLLNCLEDKALEAWQPGATNWTVREFYQGKFGLPGAQARWGLPLPPSRICADIQELRDFATATGWPVIIKPSDHLGGLGIEKFSNENELAARSGKLNFPLLAQKFITGENVVLEVFCSRGRVLGWLSSYVIAKTNGPFSSSTGRLFCALPVLQPLAELVAAKTRFEGICGIDCIEEAGTGRIYFIEFNPRPTSGWRFGRYAGVDFYRAVAMWMQDAPVSFTPLTLPLGREVTAHYFPSDLIRCVRRRDWCGLAKWLPGAKSRHDICWDDPGLLLAWLAAGLRNWKRRKTASRSLE